jgi:hypothetical protein
MRIRNKVEIQVRYRLKTELWRATDAHNGGVEDQNGALEVLKTSGRRFAPL